MLGVPGLMNVYRSGGRDDLLGAGRRGRRRQGGLYLRAGDDPLLSRREADPEERARPGNAPTPTTASTCWSNLKELVVKEVHGSGGYGMLVGPKSTKEQIAAYAERIKADPGDFIAQPTLALSTCPTFVGEGHRAAACRPAALLPGRPRGASLSRAA